jgi:hypothetical protein
MRLKLAILGLLVLFASSWTMAQDCIPDQTITDIGFFPKIMDDAVAGESYKQVLQIRVFKDTVVIIAGNPTLATIDSINVVDIMGLPNGFYYTCSPMNCSYIPDSTGCAALIGNPTSSDVGSYPILIAIEVYGKIFGSINTMQPDTIDQFTLEVTGTSSTSNVFELKTNLFYPNPSSSASFKINPLLYPHISSLKCFNIMGQAMALNRNQVGFSIQNATDGLYSLVVEMENGKRMVEKIQIQR